jgi:hypothetical protein
MKRQAAAAALAAILVTACGGGGGGNAAQGKAKQQIKLRNDGHERLKALPDNLQRIGLMRQIRNTGNRCPLRVESGRYQGEHETLAMWTARCDDNRQWAIFLSPSGYVQVRNCADMEQLGLPRCAELPPAPPQAPRKARRPGVTTDRS